MRALSKCAMSDLLTVHSNVDTSCCVNTFDCRITMKEMISIQGEMFIWLLTF